MALCSFLEIGRVPFRSNGFWPNRGLCWRYNVKCHSASNPPLLRHARRRQRMVTVDPKAGPKYIYRFTEGNAHMRELLGGKGANLAEMTNMGLRVPPGFTVTTEACMAYLASGRWPEGLEEEVEEHLRDLESDMGKRLGDPQDPLLVSVRSGAKFSMPGMMDTVLNLGLNDESVRGLAKQSEGDWRFAHDSYRRFVQMFGEIVMGIPGEAFDDALDQAQGRKGERGQD